MKPILALALLGAVALVAMGANYALNGGSACCQPYNACCQECTEVVPNVKWAKRASFGNKLFTGSTGCAWSKVTCPKIKYYSNAACTAYIEDAPTAQERPQCTEAGGDCMWGQPPD